MPIASITKLMTVLVVLEHREAHGRRPGRSARAAGRPGVGQPARRRDDHRARPRERRADPVGERRRRRARALGRARLRRLRRPDERQGEGARPHRLALRPARRARRAGRVLERPRRDAARSRAMRIPVVRELVAETDDTIAGGRDAPHLERPARRPSRACSASRPATPTAPAGRRSPPRSGGGATVYATILGSPSRTQRNADLTSCSPTGSPSTGP